MSIDPQQIGLLIILTAAVVLLFTEWLPVDLTALLIILTLAGTRILAPDEALSGFSSEPAIMLASIFVLSSALFHTGLSARLGSWIARVAGSSYTRMLVVMMSAVALLSAFTHHVTMTAVMLPVVMRMAREHHISPSRLLMPVSFAASLGTTITIIGAPAFLIADGLLRTAGRPGLGILSIAPIGLALSAAGVGLMLLFGRYLLPDNPGGEESSDRFRLEQYYTELILLEDSPLIGKTIAEIEGAEEEDFRVVNWLRHGRAFQRPYGDAPTQQGDILLVRTTPEKIATVQQERGIALHPLIKFGEEVTTDPSKEVGSALVQAVVAPGSELVGMTIGRADFLRRYGVLVVGVWRRKGWMQTELSRIRLRDGDVLVLMGDEDSFARVADDRSFLMMVPFQGEPKPRRKARIAALIMVLSIAAAVFNVLSVEIALLAGAVAAVLTACVTPRQAYQSIDVRIYVFIAGAIPLGLALEKTGTAALLAGWLENVVSGWSPFAILLALFTVSALLTQVMSDSATTVLLAPVALALATLMDMPPEPFVITVAMAAVASFLTPIGHHGNLLIYAPGRYRFKDFLIAGTPLTIAVALIVAFLAPMLWPR
jgi:di/tricarboxylate transporter